MLTENKTSGSTTQTTRYTYDANGNTLTKTSGATSEQYSYDGFNHLVKVVNGVGTTTYAYRPDGLRSSKTVAGVQTTHIWDGQNMSAELGKTGAVLRTYIRGIGLIAEDNAAGTRQYALYNAHGDVVQLTDKNGAVTKEYLYDAFGNERSLDANDANPFRYCGEYFDVETGDIYLRARYYRPATGRFITEDPALSGLNWYIYCGNNPIINIDYSGLEYGRITDFIGDLERHLGGKAEYTNLVANQTNPSGIMVKYGNYARCFYYINNPKANTHKIGISSAGMKGKKIVGDNVNGHIMMERTEFYDAMGIEYVQIIRDYTVSELDEIENKLTVRVGQKLLDAASKDIRYLLADKIFKIAMKSYILPDGKYRSERIICELNPYTGTSMWTDVTYQRMENGELTLYKGSGRKINQVFYQNPNSYLYIHDGGGSVVNLFKSLQ